MQARPHYDVKTTDPVIGFRNTDWTRYLTVNGQDAFYVGAWCDTCGFLFERKQSDELSPTVVSDRLAAGVNELGDDLLAAAGGLLPAGDYAVVLTTVQPRLTVPGGPDDYFSHEALDLFGLPAHTGIADTPRTAYYRAGQAALPTEVALHGAARRGRTDPKRFFHFLVPMHPPHWNDRDRVAEWERGLKEGVTPTVLAVSVLDVRCPAVTPWDKDEDTWGMCEHWCLATYLLDGHHKLEAAERIGRPIKLLTFISREASVAANADIDLVVRHLAGS